MYCGADFCVLRVVYVRQHMDRGMCSCGVQCDVLWRGAVCGVVGVMRSGDVGAMRCGAVRHEVAYVWCCAVRCHVVRCIVVEKGSLVHAVAGWRVGDAFCMSSIVSVGLGCQ